MQTGAVMEWPAEIAPTLNAAFASKQGLEDQHALGGAGLFVPAAYGFNWQNGGGYGNANEGLGITYEGSGLLQRCQTPAVAQPIALADISSRDKTQNGAGWKDDGTMYTLDTTGLQGVAQSMQVRRLTPRECERLQGFPDDYTLIPYRNKPASDGPRYKALGNSMAVPVMAWIGKRIQSVIDIKEG